MRGTVLSWIYYLLNDHILTSIIKKRWNIINIVHLQILINVFVFLINIFLQSSVLCLLLYNTKALK